jgi:hypothetical protein
VFTFSYRVESDDDEFSMGYLEELDEEDSEEEISGLVEERDSDMPYRLVRRNTHASSDASSREESASGECDCRA